MEETTKLFVEVTIYVDTRASAFGTLSSVLWKFPKLSACG
jgi:hypothetical protein